jgi:hypothetical protein
VIPLKFSVPKVVRIIKSNTSKDLKKKFPFLKDVYWAGELMEYGQMGVLFQRSE